MFCIVWARGSKTLRERHDEDNDRTRPEPLAASAESPWNRHHQGDGGGQSSYGHSTGPVTAACGCTRDDSAGSHSRAAPSAAAEAHASCISLTPPSGFTRSVHPVIPLFNPN